MEESLRWPFHLWSARGRLGEPSTGMDSVFTQLPRFCRKFWSLRLSVRVRILSLRINSASASFERLSTPCTPATSSQSLYVFARRERRSSASDVIALPVSDVLDVGIHHTRRDLTARRSTIRQSRAHISTSDPSFDQRRLPTLPWH